MLFFCLFICVFVEHTRSAQGILLALCLGITSGNGEGAILGAENQTRVNYVQGMHLNSCITSLAPCI